MSQLLRGSLFVIPDENAHLSDRKIRYAQTRDFVNRIPDVFFLEEAVKRLFLKMYQHIPFAVAFEIALETQSSEDYFEMRLEEARLKTSQRVFTALENQQEERSPYSSRARKMEFLSPQRRGKIILRIFQEQPEIAEYFKRIIQEMIQTLREERIQAILRAEYEAQRRIALNIPPLEEGEEP